MVGDRQGLWRPDDPTGADPFGCRNTACLFCGLFRQCPRSDSGEPGPGQALSTKLMQTDAPTRTPRARDPLRRDKGTAVKDQYQTTVRLIERLHRRFLDVIRAELRRLDVDDINAVQALLLHNIGTEDVVIRDLKERGYYHGSNVSYNIKKLTEAGYIAQERSRHDRRATRLQLTDKGLALCDRVRTMQTELALGLTRFGLSAETLDAANQALETVERAWHDRIRHGGGDDDDLPPLAGAGPDH